MQELIDINSYPVTTTMNLLLEDKTTKENIIWATDSYEALGPEYSGERQIRREQILGDEHKDIIQPRICKAVEEQQNRTHKKGEVFTPAWLCCRMNNDCDEAWFEKPDVFNALSGTEWKVTDGKIGFSDYMAWKKYVDSRRLEITCGEAPYIVSRYDTSTGELIVPPLRRIGMLDRKLRVVNENMDDETEWLRWTVRAFQSVYGYEFQGDSLLIARINVLLTFIDYLKERWNREAAKKELLKIANIISWNFWQMDGLSGTVPYKKNFEQERNLGGRLFDVSESGIEEDEAVLCRPCRIYDWRKENSISFTSLRGAWQ